MDEYADIYFIDDNRNAVVTSDHRTGAVMGMKSWASSMRAAASASNA